MKIEAIELATVKYIGAHAGVEIRDGLNNIKINKDHPLVVPRYRAEAWVKAYPELVQISQ